MTRYGIISDMHDDFDHFCEAIKLLRAGGVDSIKHLGDLVLFGDQRSSRVIQLMQHYGIEGVGGMHDYDEARTKHPALSRISPAEKEFLSKLPRTMVLEGNTLLVHDNPDLDWAYVPEAPGQSRRFSDPDPKSKSIADVFGSCAYDRILLGHTHLAAAHCSDGRVVHFKEPGKIELRPGERWVLNPGSIGLPRDDYMTSSCAIYDSENNTFEVLRFL